MLYRLEISSWLDHLGRIKLAVVLAKSSAQPIELLAKFHCARRTFVAEDPRRFVRPANDSVLYYLKSSG